MTVKELLQQKGQSHISLEGDASVEDAINMMLAKKISSLLVTDHGKTVGIFTERDVLKSYVVEKKKAFGDILLRDAMTRDLIVADNDDDICQIMSIMTARSIRHLPVIEEGRIIGMLSMRDIIKSQVTELRSKIRYFRDYVSGMQGGLWI